MLKYHLLPFKFVEKPSSIKCVKSPKEKDLRLKEKDLRRWLLLALHPLPFDGKCPDACNMMAFALPDKKCAGMSKMCAKCVDLSKLYCSSKYKYI